jgi:catechol 2,3-dioxygenase-like lactoylglutathione lyase family enzyme
MITAIHTLLYSDDPDATRAFLRDVLEWPFVDAHDGWLIFGTGPSEMGVHPTGLGGDGQSVPAHHEISIMCDDIEKTRAELESKGATFDGPTQSAGFGLIATLNVPGNCHMLLYQPRHPIAYDL